MPLTVEELVKESENKFGLKLLCGSEGLCNPAEWVYISEDISTIPFLRGGELIITTGVTSDTSRWLFEFVTALIRQGACGLIVNVGKYLFEEDIREDIRELCAEYSFPLFIMPWHVHIFDITHEYYSRIFREARADDQICSAFWGLIEEKGDLSGYLESLKKYGYLSDGKYGVCCISCCSDTGKLDSSLLEQISFQLKKALAFYPEIYFCQPESYLGGDSGPTTGNEPRKQLVLVLSWGRREDFSAVLSSVMDSLRRRFKKIMFTAGLGMRVDSLKDLSKSFRYASTAAVIGASRNSLVCDFEELGFVRLLLAVPDRSLLEQYVEEQLGDLLAFDRENKTSYTETLRQYLLCSGSVQAMAAALYCHRNTVNHRLHFMKTQLNLPLENVQARFQWMAAFEIRSFLEYSDGTSF